MLLYGIVDVIGDFIITDILAVEEYTIVHGGDNLVSPPRLLTFELFRAALWRLVEWVKWH
jgi:hypothetical protein